MSSKKAKGKTKKKAQRAASNVFAMFDQQTIQEFKEAFNMIDVGRDGFIDKSDLSETYINLGKMASDEELEGMISEAPGPMNFTVFLTLFGDKLNGTDPEDVIRNAFGCFDAAGTGKIPEKELTRMLKQTGDRLVEIHFYSRYFSCFKSIVTFFCICCNHLWIKCSNHLLKCFKCLREALPKLLNI